MAKKLYTLTEEHRARFPEWRDKWIANALNCEPMSDHNRAVMRRAVRGLYEAAKLEAPPEHRVVFISGPISAAFAASVAAGVWYLREHPEKHQALFGRQVTEAEFIPAIRQACAFMVRRAMTGERVELPELGGVPINATRDATDDAIRAATAAATADATADATYAATAAATYAATADATYAATADATAAATRDATDAAIADAIRAATDDAIRAATYAATADATRDAIRAATYAAIADATDDAIRAAIADATAAATRDATDAAIADATAAATRDATDDAIRDATDAATRDATDAATYAATAAATYAATADATYAAIADATDDAIRAATADATAAATRDATYAAIADATDAATRDVRSEPLLVRFLVWCSRYSYRLRSAGNQWSGWTAYLSFFRYVAKLDLDYTKWAHYEDATVHGGPRYMHAKFCIIADRPLNVGKDEQHRPHSENGPSQSWRDGFTLWHWHGVRVPQRLILDPESYTTEDIRKESNTEVVRALAERMGWTKFLKRLGSKKLDSWTDDETGLTYELHDAEIVRGVTARFVRKQSSMLKDGTQPYYLEPVPETIRTAQAARKWQAMAAFLSEGDQLGGLELARYCNENPELSYDWEA